MRKTDFRPVPDEYAEQLRQVFEEIDRARELKAFERPIDKEGGAPSNQCLEAERGLAPKR